MKITSEIPGTIRYTTDGNEPTEASGAYTEELQIPEGSVLKARVYPEKSIVFEPSDVESINLPILSVTAFPKGTKLPDGSVIVLDRGSSYGEYGSFDGYPIRMSEGIDDGSVDNSFWRYLIIDSADYPDTLKWGNNVELGTILVGYSGIYNTSLINENAGGVPGFITYHTMQRRKETGFLWFIPSADEIIQAIGVEEEAGIEIHNFYWTSCEASDRTAYREYFASDNLSPESKGSESFLRLFRRI